MQQIRPVRGRQTSHFLLALGLLAGAACSSPTYENLNAVLWTQTAVEYRGNALQAYTAADAALSAALGDKSWTASLDQQEAGGYEDLPPAVILDVDETVLDNSLHQAGLTARGESFSRASWQAWVKKAVATPVPGALAFTRRAAERGVAVIYVTNRSMKVEKATRRNLRSRGFPLDPEPDGVLTRGEYSNKPTSDKGPRRRHAAKRYRILLLVGDNLGDFMSGVRGSVAARDKLAEPYASYWGRRWIVLPNPQYGSWDGALIDFDFDLGPDEQLRRKVKQLRIEQD